MTNIFADFEPNEFTIAPGYCKFNAQYTVSDFSSDTHPNADMKGADLALEFLL